MITPSKRLIHCTINLWMALPKCLDLTCLDSPLHPTCLPCLYIPTDPYNPYTLPIEVCHAPTHMLHEHAGRRRGCVLPVIGYYVLRYWLAKLLHLNLFCLLRASRRRKGCWTTKICNSGRLHNQYYAHTKILLCLSAWEPYFLQNAIPKIKCRVTTFPVPLAPFTSVCVCVWHDACTRVTRFWVIRLKRKWLFMEFLTFL